MECLLGDYQWKTLFFMKAILRFGCLLECCLTKVGGVSVKSVVTGISSVTRVSGVCVGGDGGVGMASGNSVDIGKSTVDLSKGVGISIRVSGPLAEMVSIIVGADGVQSRVSS